jgi:enoyl-CoA hydratase
VGDSDELLRSHRDGIEILTINRPAVRNALSRSLLGRIAAAMAAVDDDPAVQVVVLTSAGTAAFCAGMDLREPPTDAPTGADGTGTAAFGAFLRDGISKPLIGAAVGTAVGGGFELLLSCDLIVASEAARFGLPEVKRGLMPGGTGVLLGRRIPLALALELTMTGESITADHALRLGLVNRVVPAEQVLEEALGLAASIAQLAPLAVTTIKRLVRSAADAPLEELWALQDELRPRVFQSEDAREGIEAFAARRTPIWKGR